MDVSVLVTELPRAGGRTGGRVAVLRDITSRKRIERDLSESQATLTAALSSMTDAVFISDAQGHFVHFNHAFTTFHRFETREQTLRSLEDYPAILEVFMSDGSPAAVDLWPTSRALRGEVGVAVEYGLRRKDTGEQWIGSYNFAPIRSREGAIIGSVVTGRDITEQKRAEAERDRIQRARDEALAELEEAQQIARIGSWRWDPDRDRVTWSQQAYEIHGRDRALGPVSTDEVLGYVHPDDREPARAWMASGLSGPDTEHDQRIIRPDGSQRIVRVIRHEDPDRPGSYHGTVQDVTDQRRVEQAEAANRAKSEFCRA